MTTNAVRNYLSRFDLIFEGITAHRNKSINSAAPADIIMRRKYDEIVAIHRALGQTDDRAAAIRLISLLEMHVNDFYDLVLII